MVFSKSPQLPYLLLLESQALPQTIRKKQLYRAEIKASQNHLLKSARLLSSLGQQLRSSFTQTASCTHRRVLVLTLPANIRIFLCKEPVRMHKSFEGLSFLVEQLFPGELLSSSLFVFFSKDRSRMKVLFWDRDGFAIWYKRLEKGSFARNGQNTSIDRREFLMLLEGIEPKKIRSKIF